MKATLSPQEFVAKWSKAELKERSAAQEHFIDICHLVGHPTPAELDPKGERFTFEKGASKQKGGEGWADVWFRRHFGWEYKGKHKDLDAAYQQLLQYREALENPWLLIVSDLERILIHTNFPNTVKRIYELSLEDILLPEKLEWLRLAFYDPEKLRAPETPEQVTEAAAREFARLADQLRAWGEDSPQIAHFLIRLLFCLFAEDIGLLPKDLFTRLVERTQGNAKAYAGQLRQLFGAMTSGGWFGVDEIVYFDGGLFDDDTVLELDSTGMDILVRVSRLDWSSIEPSIIGTLFERSLDPGKRAQLGAHYTSKEDILLIVEPVLMAPLRRRWEQVQAEAKQLALKMEAAAGGARTKYRNDLSKLLTGFAQEISEVRVLDPACGSGNFLYVALREMLDLEKEVGTLAADLRLTRPFPQVSPRQLYGIEINAYAHELAQATVWIGYIQWLNENGYGQPGEPILKPLHNLIRMDAVLAYDGEGRAVEPEWPAADVVIGNPPFLGDKKMRSELGSKYVDDLRHLYADRLPGQSDYVCYWFEMARALIEQRQVQRAGLLATQGIRGGANRTVLERIRETSEIFWAESDRDWVLDGAAVHVSMVGFGESDGQTRVLNGQSVEKINADLTSTVDVTRAKVLDKNRLLAFQGVTKVGAFDLSEKQALEMISAGGNPNGRPNNDVILPWINGLDITRRPRNMWIIDFTGLSEDEASCYERPFEYVKSHVKPHRDKVRRKHRRENWWLFGETMPALRSELNSVSRYIVTPRVSKHRLFAWFGSTTIPDSAVVAFMRRDDYFFGLLHSKVHELWARRQGTQLREVESGFRYTPSSCFETFPFPWPPGEEPKGNPFGEAIADAARDLVEMRQAWLNPPSLSEEELRKRTLTNLYNKRPTWLQSAHAKLDKAVLDAYGWPHDLSDEEILERLLALNLERAAEQEGEG